MKYKLRQIKKETDSKVEEEEPEADSKPWNRTQTLFSLPYRMVYAVATQKTVILYDTQQELPFAKVSNIHYIG